MVATSVSARKSKGKNFQNDIRDDILALYPDLTENDVYSTSMGAQGIDIMLSEEARKVFPFAVECKRSEGVNVHGAMDQCIPNAKKEGLHPIVISKKNRKDALVTLEWSVFKEMLARLYMADLTESIRKSEGLPSPISLPLENEGISIEYIEALREGADRDGHRYQKDKKVSENQSMRGQTLF